MPADTYSASIDDVAKREAVASSIPELVQHALGRLGEDPGALFEANVLEAIKAVRLADPAGYQRIRAQAKRSASVGELDRLTAAGKVDSDQSSMFPHVEPWAKPVDGGELVRDLCRAIKEHVAADKPTILAAALWCMHTWCMDALTVSPLAHITAPEKRCGKTVLLTVMSELVCRALPVANISPAALFRSMEMWQPTLLIDEADTFLKENDEARGLINSGLYRKTAFVIRVEGDDHVPTQFRTWGAKVVCGIGKLADTIEDRSIPLRLRRKVAGESVAKIRHAESDQWDALRQRMARWAEDNRDDVAIARPTPASGLNDRAQDCWEPLLAIADLAGEAWAKAARNAALALHGAEEESQSIGVELLRDIRDVFERRGSSRLTSALLLEELTSDEEAPWATWAKGRPMTQRHLAARLVDFRIKPANMRTSDGIRKGYDLADFRDAFDRYLSLSVEHPPVSATPLQPHNGAGLSVNGSKSAIRYTEAQPLPATSQSVACSGSAKTVADGVAGLNTSQTAPLSQCSGVADVHPSLGKKEEGTKVERERIDI
ncbi:DUF3631 domain-containing protein [Rhodanobacter sp. DHB23]|uniref:DUF3631 domain-containing protein n=1 Tax=Rhodanobacter sp. DHB23 TaxID=2775923 RepID=UPI0017847423|nr:DUF3631 domain-containing protein [Rhodanobacter sp. DHB23]MBD8873845.1 DUF3631 domain-containing protein [Rhodanobacter sp. DHB23]